MSYEEALKQLEALMRTDPDARPRNVNLPGKTAWNTSDVWQVFELLANGEKEARIWASHREYYRGMVDATVSHGGKGRQELIAWHAARLMALDEDRYVSPAAAENGHEDGPDEPWRGIRDGRD